MLSILSFELFSSSDLLISSRYPWERKVQSGYYTMMAEDDGSPESKDEEKHKRLWAKSLEWAGITEDCTALKAAFV